MRWNRAFRYLWRLNAVLILVAAGAITFGVGALLFSQLQGRMALKHEAETGPLPPAAGDPRLFLGQASLVQGTMVMRADLLLRQEGGSFSSGGYGETRNILFVDPAETEARWLLPDDKHVIVAHSDVTRMEPDRQADRTVATVALVKAVDVDRQTGKGRLLLFGPPGRPLTEAADGVRAMHVAQLSGDQITVLYERDRQLVVATFDAATLAKRREQVMSIPVLK
jgi:hypothetical protein